MVNGGFVGLVVTGAGELDLLSVSWSESAPSSQALKCPSLEVVTSMVVSLLGQKHMDLIRSSWAAATVVFREKLGQGGWRG